MVCSNCGTENEAGRKFCGECGGRLALVCPTCGTANAPTTKFCGECATPLTAAPTAAPVAGQAQRPTEPLAQQPAPAAAPVAERRLVTVLFADLVGFTPFAEERDAEEVRETLTRYFDLAREVIERYGGVVEKFIGDAVMALWGAPVAREDDAERAVRAGLELIEAVHSLGPTIGARAGVLTGEAAVTLGATNQGMVAGDIVNTAARLQSVALPGTVLVGESTYRAASSSITFESVGEQALKGKTAPVPAWRALRIVSERLGRGRSETLEAPFVGRDDELRLLKDLFHATNREKRTRLISILGPGGIGKSRLAWEFEKYLDGIVDQVWWHTGRSPAYGQGISFWALGEMIRSRAGLAETDDEPTTRAKIAEMLDQFVPDEAERRWIEPAFLALLGVEAGVSSDQLFAAWRTFFERLSMSGTIVLVFEDLHWADSGLLDFIDHLLEWSRNLALYIVTLARPELLERRADWGAGRRNFVSLSLEPLSEPSMRELLAGLIPGLPEPAVKAIVSRADGVPLYAVETVRMLVADGRLKEEGGAYIPVGDLTSLAVPETLTALIGARLDALEPADRSLLQDAAVLGQSFTPAGLAAVSGVDAAELEPRLRSLVRRELLTHAADPRSPERGQYAFVQALIREVAYNTLARKDRKERHLAAARWFESIGTDELAGALAGQYLAAHANSPEGPEADALAAQARIALRGAAERAVTLGAHEQAMAFLVQALAVATDPSDKAELLERAGEEASAASLHESAETHLRGALELRRALDDRLGAAQATAALGSELINGRRIDAALALLETGSAEFADLSPAEAVIALEGQLARVYFLHEEPRRATEVADRVLEAAEHADYAAVLADTLVTRGSALCGLGRFVEGIGAIQAGVEFAEARGFTATALRGLNNLATFQTESDPRAAIEAARSGLTLSRRLGLRFWTLGFVQTAAAIGVRAGHWDVALSELEAELAADMDPADHRALLGSVFGLRAFRGEPVTDGFAQLEALFADASDPVNQSNLAEVRAQYAFANGRLAEAHAQAIRSTELAYYPSMIVLATRSMLWARDLASAREDVERFEATGAHGPALEANRVTLRAGVAALEGRNADALSLYRDALRAWRDLGLPWDEALCAIDMATLLDPGEREVREAAETARETLARLGAAPFLERLEGAMARSTASTSSTSSGLDAAAISPTIEA